MSKHEQRGLRAELAKPVGVAQPTAHGHPRAFELHIEEVVLHGFGPAARYEIGEAVQHELARLLAEQGIPHALTRDAEVARVNAGTLVISVDLDARGIGRQLAQSVYRSLRGDA
ncbi:MAG: hypothetical protein M3444_11515 [Acidobacteriota bacterium]|nr:hypothetical protein [Acidobacteriota bacterium]MDQ5837908.1 hypothetical protein [Acidobacteriota bacterium]